MEHLEITPTLIITGSAMILVVAVWGTIMIKITIFKFKKTGKNVVKYFSVCHMAR